MIRSWRGKVVIPCFSQGFSGKRSTMCVRNITNKALLRGGHQVLVRTKLALGDGVAMQLTVRSEDSMVAEIMTTAVA